ncbi:mitochondrial protein Pet127-domain-containing protein [Amanita rubescens]|nr:mitochondrial protein Pet127-domain-containing protein [Amanita rubescens]
MFLWLNSRSVTSILLLPSTQCRSYGVSIPPLRLRRKLRQDKRATGFIPEKLKEEPSGTDESPRPPRKGKKVFIRDGRRERRDDGNERFGLKDKKGKPTNPEYPIAYTRRVEGLIEPTGKPVLTDVKPLYPQRPIAKLSHGLDRVLFNPGVHWLQDPRSRVYNYTPWLESIPKVTDFAFERLSGFTKSSCDEELLLLLKKENKMFASSTSSMTGMLGQIYFLLSGNKTVDTRTLSGSFFDEPTCFTPGQRMPSTVIFNYRDGRYAIDSDAGVNTGQADKNVLTWMGTLLEKYLTMPPDDFTSYMRSSPATEEKSDLIKDAFRYAKSDKFIMRSQLDCHDDRLPGTGIFDVKTRACLPIRLDILNFEEHSGYLIRKQHGLKSSFEKEYYDLIRSAFLKYSFQARIGNMDGVFVAYHNAARMFGFQYVPLEQMEEHIFGPSPGIGERVFEKCVGLLEIICQEIIQCFPGKSVQCTFETRDNRDKLNIWVEPTDWDGKVRPIAQLVVKVTNYIETSEMSGSQAISSCNSDDKWSVHWSVRRLSDKEKDIRAAYQGVKARQFRAFFFPAGIDENEMPEFWANLNFGGENSESQAAYNVEQFREPSGMVQRLRKVSRADKIESDRIAVQEAGKPKIVYGQNESWVAPVVERGDKGTKEKTSRESREETDTKVQVPHCSGYDFSDEVSLEEIDRGAVY